MDGDLVSLVASKVKQSTFEELLKALDGFLQDCQEVDKVLDFLSRLIFSTEEKTIIKASLSTIVSIADPKCFYVLQAIALQANSTEARSQAILKIAKHFNNHPHAFYFLMGLARFSDVPLAATTAVEALVKYFQHLPQTYLVLKRIALQHKGSIARVAIKALAKAYRDNPDCYTTLVAIATSFQKCPDYNPGRYSPASSASVVLAEHFQDNPQTLETLTTIVLTNPCYLDAVEAMKAIAKYYPKNHSLLALLTKFALTSRDYQTVLAAIKMIVKYFNHDFEAIYALQNIVLEGKSSLHRQALPPLVEHFYNHPDFYGVLKKLIFQSRSLVALDAILKYFSDLPETLSILVTIIVQDSRDEYDKYFWSIEDTASHRLKALFCHRGDVVAVKDIFDNTHYLYKGKIIPAKYGEVELKDWQAEWILTETNQKIRELLVEAIGYFKFCENLPIIVLDTYDDYNLIKLEAENKEILYFLTVHSPENDFSQIIPVYGNYSSAKDAVAEYISSYSCPLFIKDDEIEF